MLLQHLWQAGLGGSWLQGSCREGLAPRHGFHCDIYTNDGVLIVPTGTKISLIILKKLYNFSEMPGIKEPIFIEQ